MEVKNKVYPSKDQMRGFFETATDNEPIYMVSLLKFKDKAEYKDGRKTKLTGREAYQHREAGLAGQLNIETKEIND